MRGRQESGKARRLSAEPLCSQHNRIRIVILKAVSSRFDRQSVTALRNNRRKLLQLLSSSMKMAAGCQSPVRHSQNELTPLSRCLSQIINSALQLRNNHAVGCSLFWYGSWAVPSQFHLVRYVHLRRWKIGLMEECSCCFSQLTATALHGPAIVKLTFRDAYYIGWLYKTEEIRSKTMFYIIDSCRSGDKQITKAHRSERWNELKESRYCLNLVECAVLVSPLNSKQIKANVLCQAPNRLLVYIQFTLRRAPVVFCCEKRPETVT